MQKWDTHRTSDVDAAVIVHHDTAKDTHGSDDGLTPDDWLAKLLRLTHFANNTKESDRQPSTCRVEGGDERGCTGKSEDDTAKGGSKSGKSRRSRDNELLVPWPGLRSCGGAVLQSHSDDEREDCSVSLPLQQTGSDNAPATKTEIVPTHASQEILPRVWIEAAAKVIKAEMTTKTAVHCAWVDIALKAIETANMPDPAIGTKSSCQPFVVPVRALFHTYTRGERHP